MVVNHYYLKCYLFNNKIFATIFIFSVNLNANYVSLFAAMVHFEHIPKYDFYNEL